MHQASTRESTESPEYIATRRRRDIQGLRAVAVLLVALDHAGVGFLKGGYVGVDVFFVISGYLITGLLVSAAEKSRGHKYFSDFYARRARRILPAATLTLVVTDIVASHLLNLYRAHQVLVDSLYSTFFVANSHFASIGTNYFAIGQPPSPVQQSWSLSVEEQFYLVWPLLVAVALLSVTLQGRRGRHRHRPLSRGALCALEIIAGFDPFVHSARDDGNAHIRRASIERAEGRFDLIMFNHSLEHIPRPVEALRNARTRLAADGAIAVRVPLAGTFADRRYGGNWVSLDPPRHLTVPSRTGFEVAASASGLEIARVFFDSLPSQIWASEQYRQDIPLSDARSGLGQKVSRDLRRRSRELNRGEDGDSAGFILRPKLIGRDRG
jgi:hypothetical protein